jgi:hypothetical protein
MSDQMIEEIAKAICAVNEPDPDEHMLPGTPCWVALIPEAEAAYSILKPRIERFKATLDEIAHARWSSVNGDDPVKRIQDFAKAALGDGVSRSRIEQLEAHIREQITFADTRIQDGIELGATVWRIALEDIVRENRAALNPQQDGGE